MIKLIDMSILLDLFDDDPFNDHFLMNPFGIRSVFEFIDKEFHVVEDHVPEEITHVVEDHAVEEITEIKSVEEITEIKTCPVVRSFIGSTFKDDCIVVNPSWFLMESGENMN